MQGEGLRPSPSALPHPLQSTTRRVAPCGRRRRVLRFARWSAAAFRGRGALAARRRVLACGLLWPLGCLSRFHRRPLCDGSRPGQQGKGSASPASSPGPSAALRAAACARVPLPALALRPQCTGRRTQERRRQQTPELPQCPQTTPQQRALNLGIRVA